MRAGNRTDLFDLVDGAPAGRCATGASLFIRMERCLVVDRNLLTRLNVAQGNEEYVTVENLHKGIWLARMIDVMRSIPPTAAIQTPTVIDSANP